MRSRLSPPSDPLKPRPSSAIIFAGNAVVFLALSLLTQRMIYSFLFAVSFLLFVYEVVALWKQKRERRGLHRRNYSDAEYRSLGMTRPKKDRRSAVQAAINVLLSLAASALTLCSFTTNDPALSSSWRRHALPADSARLQYRPLYLAGDPWTDLPSRCLRFIARAVSLSSAGVF